MDNTKSISRISLTDLLKNNNISHITILTILVLILQSCQSTQQNPYYPDDWNNNSANTNYNPNYNPNYSGGYSDNPYTSNTPSTSYETYTDYNTNNAYSPYNNTNTPPYTSRNSKSYEVVRGDTLWRISKKYNVSVGAIKQANGLSNDTIYTGQLLTIP